MISINPFSLLVEGFGHAMAAKPAAGPARNPPAQTRKETGALLPRPARERAPAMQRLG